MSGERRWRVSGILLGAAAAIGCSLFYESINVTAASVSLTAQGVARAELLPRLKADTEFLIVGLITQLPFFCLGGFIAARMAKRREWQHGAATAAVCVLLSAVMAAGTTGFPWWHAVASYGMIPPMALLGARFGRNRNRETPRPN